MLRALYKKYLIAITSTPLTAMTLTTQKLTFEEYLKYNDGTDTTYELVKGELVPMSLGTGKHGRIIKLLERVFETEITRSSRPLVSLALLIGV